MLSVRPARPDRLQVAWVSARVLSETWHAASLVAPLETGGVLMGYVQGSDAIVTTWIGPGPQARHGQSYFEPDYEFQEDEIARIYQGSGRVTTYLGDWHSHPGGSLALSGTDRQTLRRISNHSKARAKQPLMMILAGRDPWAFGVWTWQRRLIPALGRANKLNALVYHEPEP